MRRRTTSRPRGRALIVSVGAAALSLAAAPAFVAPARADDSKVCVDGNGAAKIAACTRAIQSGRWRGRDLAWAFIDRGNGYEGGGDPDRAIADYQAAIRLETNDANAYIGLGNA